MLILMISFLTLTTEGKKGYQLFTSFSYEMVFFVFKKYIEGCETPINTGDVLLQIYFLFIR